MHIVTGPQFDTDAGLSRYLLKTQAEIVLDDWRYQFYRKANRTGISWTMALKDVRKRIMCPGRDCLFTTQNWNGALEFGRYIEFWIDLYKLGKFVISRNEEWITVHRDDGKGGSIATQEKVGIYKFDGGSRIILFSSSPWAIQTFEGDVRWDECEFHERQEQMHTALSTRIQFGYDYIAWSACNGVNTWVNQVLFKLASQPGSGWKVRIYTIHDAIAEGLVEKINERSGMKMTREEFLEDARRRALTPAIFAERFECNPSDTGSSIVPWSVIERCRDQFIYRHHLHDHQIKELFGLPDTSAEYRMKKMHAWMAAQFGVLHGKEKMRIGFDVAASGDGDLAAMWIDAKTPRGLEQRALLTTQTEDWDFLTTALMWFMELPDARGCGDATGLGRQITWTAEQRTGGRFVGVPFTRNSKSEMGSRLMNSLTSGECRLATGNDDVAMDIYSTQKAITNGVLTFDFGTNPLNAASHGDMCAAKMLANHTEASGNGAPFGFSRVKAPGDHAPQGEGLRARMKKMMGL